MVQDGGNVIDLVTKATAMRPNDLTRGRRQTFGAGEADQSLWGRQQAGKEGEFGEMRDLGIGEYGCFAEDREAASTTLASVTGKEREECVGFVSRRDTYKPTMSSWRLSKDCRKNMATTEYVGNDGYERNQP